MYGLDISGVKGPCETEAEENIQIEEKREWEEGKKLDLF